MSVSRDFIDSYSPEASHPRHRPRQAAPFLPPHERGVWSDNVSFRFPGGIRAFPEKRTPISGLPEIGTQGRPSRLKPTSISGLPEIDIQCRPSRLKPTGVMVFR